MLMPKQHRIRIYEYLFKEGVMVAEKDFHKPRHPDLDDEDQKNPVPNLHVIKAMQSLKSRGYVKEQFSWRHYYWYLTNEGITYLRDYLHLPPEIVPATLKKKVAPATAAPTRMGARPDTGPRGQLTGVGRDEYRRTAGGVKDIGPGVDSNIGFAKDTGFGRGRGFGGGFGSGKD